jgi:hypothetical protein
MNAYANNKIHPTLLLTDQVKQKKEEERAFRKERLGTLST